MKKYSVTVPSTMSEETVNTLIEKIRTKYNVADNIEVITDDRIIGGFVLYCDGEITDCSVSGQLKMIKKHLSGKEQ